MEHFATDAIFSPILCREHIASVAKKYIPIFANNFTQDGLHFKYRNGYKKLFRYPC